MIINLPLRCSLSSPASMSLLRTASIVITRYVAASVSKSEAPHEAIHCVAFIPARASSSTSHREHRQVGRDEPKTRLTETSSVRQRESSRGELGRHECLQASIPAFAPGQQLIFGLAQGLSSFESADASVTPKEFVITTEYEFSGRREGEHAPVAQHT